MPANAQPWLLNDEEMSAERARMEDWFSRSSRADLRILWDEIAKNHDDEVVEIMSQMAEHMFFLMARRFPTLKIGDES
jgi:hypothetical protein